MPYNPAQVFTWSNASDASGDDFQLEFARIYGNAAAAMLREGIIKVADYTVLNADTFGVLRAQNPNANHSIQTFYTSNPVKVTTASHGLSNGDIIHVHQSTNMREVGTGFWPITLVDGSNFTLPFDNSGGSGGTLSWAKVMTITLPTPAAGNLDKQILVVNDGPAPWTDAVRITDGVEDYYLDRPGQHLRMVSTGAGGRWIPVNPFHLLGRGSTRPGQIFQVYSGEAPPDIADLMTAASGSVNMDAHLTEKTSAVLLDVKISGSNEGGIVEFRYQSGATTHVDFGAKYTGSGASAFEFSGTVIVPTSTMFGDGSQFHYTKGPGVTIDKCRILGYFGWSLLQ